MKEKRAATGVGGPRAVQADRDRAGGGPDGGRRNQARRARGRRSRSSTDGEELHCTLALRGARRGRRATPCVAGMDEVGRGALCGPVVACAVVLGDGFDADGHRRLQAPHRAAAGGAWPRASASKARGLRRGRRRPAGDRPPQHPARHLPRHAARGAGPGRAARPHPGRRAAPCPASPCPSAPIVKGDALSRLDRGRLHRGQGGAGRDDARVRPALSRLRPGPQHGLRQRRPPRGPAAPGARPRSTAAPSTGRSDGCSERRGTEGQRGQDQPRQAQAGRRQAGEGRQARPGDRPLPADRRRQPARLEHHQEDRGPLRQAEQDARGDASSTRRSRTSTPRTASS